MRVTRPNTSDAALASAVLLIASYHFYQNNQMKPACTAGTLAVLSATIVALQHPRFRTAKDTIITALNRTWLGRLGLWQTPTPGGTSVSAPSTAHAPGKR